MEMPIKTNKLLNIARKHVVKKYYSYKNHWEDFVQIFCLGALEYKKRINKKMPIRSQIAYLLTRAKYYLNSEVYPKSGWGYSGYNQYFKNIDTDIIIITSPQLNIYDNTKDDLKEGISTLNEQQKQIFILLLAGYRACEIIDILGIKEGQYNYLYRQAKLKILEHFSNN